MVFIYRKYCFHFFFDETLDKKLSMGKKLSFVQCTYDDINLSKITDLDEVNIEDDQID